MSRCFELRCVKARHVEEGMLSWVSDFGMAGTVGSGKLWAGVVRESWLGGDGLVVVVRESWFGSQGMVWTLRSVMVSCGWQGME